MHVNTDPPAPARRRLPCLRDMANLLDKHLHPQLIMLAPLDELARRLNEISTKYPHFQEETPLVLVGEVRRRQLLAGQPHVARPLTAEPAFQSAHREYASQG
jgi:hypothetical protein